MISRHSFVFFTYASLQRVLSGIAFIFAEIDCNFSDTIETL